MTELSTEDLIKLLNTLLEAERAGAKTIAAFLDDYPQPSRAWNQLHQVQRDEAENCALLIAAICSLEGEPSHATGDFLDKALAIRGRAARLAFLNRGQGWVERKIRESLPHITNEPIHKMLCDMLISHIVNIEICDDLLRFINDGGTA